MSKQIFEGDEVDNNSKKLKKDQVAEERLKRDTTGIYDYYKAWDKFALEQEENADKDSDGDKSDAEEPNEDGFIPARNPKPEKESGPMS